MLSRQPRVPRLRRRRRQEAGEEAAPTALRSCAPLSTVVALGGMEKEWLSHELRRLHRRLHRLHVPPSPFAERLCRVEVALVHGMTVEKMVGRGGGRVGRVGKVERT